MSKIVNVSLQIIPFGNEPYKYFFIDKAIEVIKNSNIKYQVCPFETVMEGDFDQIMEIIKKAKQTCFEAGAIECVINIRIHEAKNQNILMDDKLKKYRL